LKSTGKRYINVGFAIEMDGLSGKRRFRFGVFEVDEESGELRKQGRQLSLQGQPFQVLVMLLGRPGELVSRTEVQKKLWPDGTFVDFDHGLNTAINKIRDVLDDSASSPCFVETLARRGYRFIAPVEVTEAPSLLAIPEKADPGTRPALLGGGSTGPCSSVGYTILTRADEVPQAPAFVVRLLFLLLQVMYLSFYIASLARLGVVEQIVGAVMSHTSWVVVLIIVTGAVGIPTRLYLIAAVGFNARGLRDRFLRIFPVILPFDLLWALAPFLLAQQIGFGLALSATAALLYVPFAQRSLILMGAGR
jgi:cholera toxin transcriptional activator